MIRALLVSVLAVGLSTVLGCASGSGPAPEQDSGFGNEGRADPGMSGSGSGMSGQGSANDLMSVYFDFDQHALSADARSALKHNADVLSRNGDLRVTIEGNCDERGSEEYNLALGQKRADSARRYLVDLGVAASRLTTVSFGEEKPAVRGSNEAAWAKNRRDDFVPR